jgi:fibronectin-binding autotransporter adhesin
VNAIPAGGLVVVGDGIGGARADRLIVRNSHQIDDTADVVVGSSGLLDLGTFNASETIGSVSGAGNVDLGPGGVFSVSGTASTSFSGSITGAGSFIKGGSGVLDLTGASDILGGTTVNGTGSLLVNGTLGGAVIVDAGATLGGDGSILGPVTLNGGTLSPGNSPGSLDTGDLSMATGTLLAELNSRTSYDSLNVTGSVTLGGTLTLSIGAGPFVGSDVLSLIINDGTDSVNGTFAGLPEGSLVGSGAGVNFFISYVGNVDGGATPNDVVLFIPEPGSATLLLGGLGSLLALRRRRQNA